MRSKTNPLTRWLLATLIVAGLTAGAAWAAEGKVNINEADAGPADPGIVPDDVIYATDPNETVDLVSTITAFGTSSNFNGAYALDADFNPAFLAESGSGYGLDHIVQLGFVDLGAGFATGYESFSFKIKSDDLPNNTIVVKLEQGVSTATCC